MFKIVRNFNIHTYLGPTLLFYSHAGKILKLKLCTVRWITDFPFEVSASLLRQSYTLQNRRLWLLMKIEWIWRNCDYFICHNSLKSFSTVILKVSTVLNKTVHIGWASQISFTTFPLVNAKNNTKCKKWICRTKYSRTVLYLTKSLVNMYSFYTKYVWTFFTIFSEKIKHNSIVNSQSFNVTRISVHPNMNVVLTSVWKG